MDPSLQTRVRKDARKTQPEIPAACDEILLKNARDGVRLLQERHSHCVSAPSTIITQSSVT